MAEPRSSEPAARSWHATAAEEAVSQLETRPAGLAVAEAARRLASHGPNQLPAARPRSVLMRLLSQFDNLLIYVLLASSVITALPGHWVDTAVILLVVVLNAVVGFVQEGRAEQALDAVRKMVTQRASVLRDGRRVAIPAEQIVPGDWVLLEAGDRVPADVRVARARNLRIEEAVLTGESVAVEKSSRAVAVDAALGDRSSMAFSGTSR